MFDIDLTRDQMLDNIGWTASGPAATLSDLNDVKARSLDQFHASTLCYPSDYHMGRQSFLLYRARFPHVPVSDLYENLVKPAKRAMGNAFKWGNGGDRTKPVVVDHYVTKRGIVVAVGDRGGGFDCEEALSRFRDNAKYFTDAGSGFKTFAECRSLVSYADAGKTVLIQYRVEPDTEGGRGQQASLAKDESRTLELIEGLAADESPDTLLYRLAQYGPSFVRRFWAEPRFLAQLFGALPAEVRTGRCLESGASELLRIRRDVVTVAYHLGDTRFVAKFYLCGTKGQHAYEVLKALWADGFRRGEAWQVPEPLSYDAEHRVLLTRAAEGANLSGYLADRDAALENQLRNVAGWLVKLHSSSLRLSRNGGEFWRPRHYLERRLARLSGNWAERSGLARRLAGVTEDILRQAAALEDGVVVQRHGDLKPPHAFHAKTATTVIDFDHSAPGDPAVDLAVYLYETRLNLFGHVRDGAQLDAATWAFLCEYASALPDHTRTLSCHWHMTVLSKLDGILRKPPAGGGQALEALVDFHCSEFERISRLVEDLGA
jgi:hypothetical protein